MDYKTKCEELAVLITEYFIFEDAKRAWLQDPKQLSPDKRFEEYARITNAIRETREKMGLAAKRGVMRGNPNVYQNAMDSLGKRGSTKDEYNDMQKAFEMDEFAQQQEHLNTAYQQKLSPNAFANLCLLRLDIQRNHCRHGRATGTNHRISEHSYHG